MKKKNPMRISPKCGKGYKAKKVRGRWACVKESNSQSSSDNPGPFGDTTVPYGGNMGGGGNSSGGGSWNTGIAGGGSSNNQAGKSTNPS